MDLTFLSVNTCTGGTGRTGEAGRSRGSRRMRRHEHANAQARVCYERDPKTISSQDGTERRPLFFLARSKFGRACKESIPGRTDSSSAASPSASGGTGAVAEAEDVSTSVRPAAKE